MREYDHFKIDGEVVLPDPTSSKARYGSHFPEYLDNDSEHFLRKGHTTFPKQETVYQLTEPSPPIINAGRFSGVGGDWIAVEMEDPSGFYFQTAIKKSKVIWDE